MKHAQQSVLGLVLGAMVASGCAAHSKAAVQPSATPARDPNLHIPPPLAAQARRVTSELARIGLRASVQAFVGFLPSGNHASYAVRLDAGTCTTLVTLATRNVRDVDAALYTPEGELLAVDSEPNAHPTIQACTETAQDVYYVLQIIEGDGSFVVLPFVGDRDSRQVAARVIGGRPAWVQLTAARDGREDPMAALAEGMRKRGFVQARPAEQVFLARGERVRAPLPASVGECYTLAAFGDAAGERLSLRVLDARGALLAEGRDDARSHAALQLCAHTPGPYTLEIESAHGGRITLVAFRADVATAGGDEGLWLGKRASETPP
jgi:hypothetical protein